MPERPRRHAPGSRAGAPAPLPLAARQAILFLADRLAMAESRAVARRSRMVDSLADEAGMPTFRHQPWYSDLNEAGALGALRSPAARRAALVVLALILKTDLADRPAERAEFTRIRMALGAEPVSVPRDVTTHRQQALRYLAS